MLTMSIDPGVRCACAVWLDGQLVSAKLFGGLGGQVHPCLEPVDPVVEFACEFLPRLEMGKLLGLPSGKPPFDEIVIEKPVVYDTKHQKGDQQDLIGLAIVVGALTSALAPYAQGILHVTPSQWKGQTPKPVTKKRAIKALSEDELAVVELPTAKGLQHNCWDAVGIGLHRWGKMR